MPDFRQQAEELAHQLTAAIAEARYWQLQAEQQIADEDRQARTAADSARKNTLDAAARQRDAAVAALVAARDKELAAALADYKSTFDPLPGKVDALTQVLGTPRSPGPIENSGTPGARRPAPTHPRRCALANWRSRANDTRSSSRRSCR